jgi:hypothetical protein
MGLYRFCGLTLDSNIGLPELEPCEGASPDLIFRLEPGTTRLAGVRRWNRQWYRHDGDVLLSYVRKQSHSIFRFPRVADFIVSADHRSIRCVTQSDTSLETVKHLLLDLVLPRVLSQRGQMVIHASCVLIPGGTVAFMGASGAGKSTIAAALHSRGFPILSDDCLLLQERGDLIYGAPSYVTLRLWPDSVTGVFGDDMPTRPVTHQSSKKRLLLPQGDTAPKEGAFPLHAIYCLDRAPRHSEGIDIRRQTSKRDAFLTLARNSFQLNTIDLESIDEMFTSVERIITAVPLYSLNFRRDYDNLDALCRAVLDKEYV